jgi:hypothetical protein
MCYISYSACKLLITGALGEKITEAHNFVTAGHKVPKHIK